MGTWRTLHPRRILHAPGAISVHGNILPGEPGTHALQPRTKWSPDNPPQGKMISENIFVCYYFRYKSKLDSLIFKVLTFK